MSKNAKNQPTSPTPSIVQKFMDHYYDTQDREKRPPNSSKEAESETKTRPNTAVVSSRVQFREKPPASSSQRVQMGPKTLGRKQNVFLAADQAEDFLRQQLLQRGSRHGDTSLAEWKHFYKTNCASPTAPMSTETSFNLAQIIGGTTVSTRVSNTILLHKLRLKFRIEVECPFSVATTSGVDPQTFHVILWREKVPVTPGTPPTLYATDTNPPTSATAMFSRLGVGITDDSMDLVVRNPSTQMVYHIYKMWRLIQPVHNQVVATAPSGVTTSVIATPWVHIEDFELELGCQQIYQTFSDTDSEVNNIYLTIVANNNMQGYISTFAYTSDIEFRDIQL